MILKKRNITEVIPLTLHRIFDTFLPADSFHYGVPLGPLAISRVLIWKLQTCLKFRPFRKREARDRELSHSLSHSRSLALALSLSRASRFLKPVNFRHVWGFYVKTSRFYFKIKRRGSRSRVAPTEHHRNVLSIYLENMNISMAYSGINYLRLLSLIY